MSTNFTDVSSAATAYLALYMDLKMARPLRRHRTGFGLCTATGTDVLQTIHMSTLPTRACTGATATAEDDRFLSDAYSWNSVKIANTNESVQGSQRLMEKSSLMYWGSIGCRNTGSATRAVVRKILLRR
jgi:hypothetical protein